MINSANPILGQIIMFAGTFNPRGWAFCDGQLLAISSNDALFSLLGTIYGGDGRTTFALPDLRGRAPIHYGNGPGLTSRSIGQKLGAENVTLSVNQLPSHTHVFGLNNTANRTSEKDPSSNYLGNSGTEQYHTSANLNMGMTALTGGGQAHNNRQPYLGLNYIIALQGIFPSRN